MEGSGVTPLSTPTSASFRLRSPSLNSLRLRRIFDMFDCNGDGIITVNEISQALGLLGMDAELVELESVIQSYVKPENDGLLFEDFVQMHQSLGSTYFGLEGQDEDLQEEQRMTQEEFELSEAFKVFDEDGDGYISARELQVVLGKLGFAEGNEIDKVEKMINSVDSNQDGRVDFFEFKDMMRSVIVPSS